MTTQATCYHAGCPVCIEIEQSASDKLNQIVEGIAAIIGSEQDLLIPQGLLETDIPAAAGFRPEIRIAHRSEKRVRRRKQLEQ